MGKAEWIDWTPELLWRFVEQWKYEGIPVIDFGCKFIPSCDCGKIMYEHDGSYFCSDCGYKCDGLAD